MRLLLFIFFIFITSCLLTDLYAQSADSITLETDLQQGNILEQAAEQAGESFHPEEWQDHMEQLQDAPVNMNNINTEDLLRIPFLNEIQALNLQTYVTQYGPLASIYELQLIEGFNQEFIEQIEPYISFGFQSIQRFTLRTLLKHAKANINIGYHRQIEKQAAYNYKVDSLNTEIPSSAYLGSPDALLLKFTANHRDRLRYGFVAQKDAGETMLHDTINHRRGFDFYSGYVYLKDVSKWKHLVLGDYHLQLGQGLTLWTGFSMGNSTTVLPSVKRGNMVSPSGSSSEAQYLRGFAAVRSFNRVTSLFFISYGRRDASLEDADSLSEQTAISSILESGYHRTVSELQSRKTIREFVTGAHAYYRSNRWKLGCTIYHQQYNRNIILNTNDELLKTSIQRGNNFGGIDWRYTYKRLTVYGESSLQFKAGNSHLAGLSFSPDPSCSFSAIFRHYGLNYNNPYSAAFGVNSENSNERGLYLGFMSSVLRKSSLTLSVDYCRFPWLKYRVDSPSDRIEYRAQLSSPIGRNATSIIRYSFVSSFVNSVTATDEPMHHLVENSRHSMQFQLDIKVFPWLRLNNKVYMVISGQDISASKGYFISQDVFITPLNGRWNLSARYAMFEVESTDSRIYVYENSFPSAFSIPSISGNGCRSYLMFRMKTNKSIELGFRYSISLFPGLNQNGEGSTSSEGNHRSELLLNLRLKLYY